MARYARLNHKNLHYSTGELTDEQAASEQKDGIHLVKLADGQPQPPYGHRYDEATGTFVEDPEWLAENADAAREATLTGAELLRYQSRTPAQKQADIAAGAEAIRKARRL